VAAKTRICSVKPWCDNPVTSRQKLCILTLINKNEVLLWGRIVVTAKRTFHCPNCNALYQVVKVEAGPETINREITCRVCGGPLSGREGKFVIKYFLLRNAARTQKWKRPHRHYRSERG